MRECGLKKKKEKESERKRERESENNEKVGCTCAREIDTERKLKNERDVKHLGRENERERQ